MTLEDIYRMAMTPLPQPPDISPEVKRIMEYLKSIQTPTIPQLPTMPANWPQRPPVP